jgi:hypothetical protein
MRSIAKSAPPRNRTIPNARNQRKKETRLWGASLSRRCEDQILAARAGDVAAKPPSTIATVLNNRSIAVDIAMRFVLYYEPL